MQNTKTVIRILRIMDHITSSAFIFLMLFLWHTLSSVRDFLLVSIPSTIIFGSMQGNSKLLVRILTQNIHDSNGAYDDGESAS